MPKNEKPDAIFSASDFSAVGAMIAARSLGINIPFELGIAGFANEPFTEFVTPSLTSVDQDSINMGRVTARLFLKLTDSVYVDNQTEKIVLTPKLIVRESSSRISSKI